MTVAATCMSLEDFFADTDDTDTLISQLNMANNGDSVYSANIGGNADGSDDGTVTVSGNALTATDQSGANGLKLLYTGDSSASGISLDYTTGLGSQLYFTVDDMLNETTGSVENEIQALSDQNDFTQSRIDVLLQRLDQQRQSLLSRFIAMETALTSMNSQIDQIRQTFNALTKSNSTSGN